MKPLIVIALLLVVGALAGAGVVMLRPRRGAAATSDAQDTRMARALALRVGLSIAVFLLVMLGWWLGWIRPTHAPFGG